jgi:hypothetical protein
VTVAIRVRDGAALPRRRRLGRVRQDEDGAAVLVVAEEEADAVVLQDAAQEGVVALSVLRAQVENGVLLREVPLVHDAPAAEERVRDAARRGVLEHPVIRRLREEPEPWDDAHLVGREPCSLGLQVIDRLAHARPDALARRAREGLLPHDREPRALAGNGVEVDVVLR